MQQINDYPDNLEESFRPYMSYLPKLKNGPDIIIGGAMKSGTTSLYKWLAESPEIVPFKNWDLDEAITKRSKMEAKFFCKKRNVVDTDKIITYLAGWDNTKVGKRVEKSPTYLGNADVAANHIKKMCPDVKFICILREPVSRFISHLNHRLREYTLPNNESTLKIDNLNELNEWNFFSRGDTSIFFKKSCYSKPITLFQQALGEKNVLVVIMERLFNESTQKNEQDKICNFLNIERIISPIRTYNSTSKMNQVTVQASENFRKELKNLYLGEVDSLKKMLNDSIPEWKY